MTNKSTVTAAARAARILAAAGEKKAAEDVRSILRSLSSAQATLAVITRDNARLRGQDHQNIAHSPQAFICGEILTERRRQIDEEGRAPEDDVGRASDLAAAAGCYALFADAWPNEGYPPPEWPWDPEWWKPRDWRRDLTRAGALIAASIEASLRQEGEII